jgi:hypothetical protein
MFLYAGMFPRPYLKTKYIQKYSIFVPVSSTLFPLCLIDIVKIKKNLMSIYVRMFISLLFLNSSIPNF